MTELKDNWASGLRQGVLSIPQCEQCGAWNWYPLAACRACGATRFAWRRLSPNGRLHSWTRVHRRFTSHEIGTPYLVGLVELADAPGVRIPCRLHQHGAADPGIDCDGILLAESAGDQPYWEFVC